MKLIFAHTHPHLSEEMKNLQVSIISGKLKHGGDLEIGVVQILSRPKHTHLF